MSEKHSLANKKRWANVPESVRSKRMSKIASIKQSKMSVKAKREHSLKMLKARDGL